MSTASICISSTGSIPRSRSKNTLGAIREQQQAGKVRHVGLSEVDVDTIEAARRVVPIASVQNRYNLLDRGWDDVVDHCERAGIVFIAWGPLGGDERNRLDDAIADIDGLAGLPVNRVALAWLLRRSATTVVIPGTTQLPHLADNVAAAGLRLDVSHVEQLTRLQARPNRPGR